MSTIDTSNLNTDLPADVVGAVETIAAFVDAPVSAYAAAAIDHTKQAVNELVAALNRVAAFVDTPASACATAAIDRTRQAVNELVAALNRIAA